MSKKITRKQTYHQLIADWEAGKFGENISLRQACIKAGISYSQVIKSKAEV